MFQTSLEAQRQFLPHLRGLRRFYNNSSGSAVWYHYPTRERVHTGLSVCLEGPVIASDSSGYMCAYEVVVSVRPGVALAANHTSFDGHYGVIYTQLQPQIHCRDLYAVPTHWANYMLLPPPAPRAQYCPNIINITPRRDLLRMAMNMAGLGAGPSLAPNNPSSTFNTPVTTRSRRERGRLTRRRLFTSDTSDSTE